MRHVRTKYYNDDRNGQIDWQAEYDGDKLDGLFESFHEDGSIQERSNWKNGKRDGLFEWFRRDGSTCVRSNYKNGVEIPINDKVKLTVDGVDKFISRESAIVLGLVKE